MSLASGVLGAAILWVSAPLVAEIMHSPQLESVLPVISGYFIVRALGTVPDALLLRRLQFKGLAIRTIVATTLSGAIAIALAFLGFGVWALVAQVLVQATASTTMVWIASRFRPRLQFDFHSSRDVLRFSWKVLVVDLLSTGVGQGDKFVVGAVLGPVALGYYTIAARILNVVVDAFTGVMSSMAVPVFARLKKDPEYTARTLTRVTTLSLAATVPAFGLLFLLAPVLVPTAFGAQWTPSVPVLQALCIGSIVSSITYFDRGVLYAADRADLEIIAVGVLAVGTVLAAYVGAQYGLVAVAIAVTARMFLTLPLRLWLLKIAIGLRLRTYVWSWKAPVAGAVALFFTAAVLSQLLRDSREPVEVLVTSAGALLAYSVCIALLDRKLIHMLRGLAARS